MQAENNLWKRLATPECFTKELDIDGLAQSALRSFAIIEPWCQAKRSSDHPLIVTMVDKIVKQAKEYIVAIEMSVDTAAKGCAFVDDALELCDFMRTGQVPIEHLNQFLKDMLELANLAHESALATNEQFKRIRSSLFQITKNIPLDVDKIRQEKLDVSLVVVNVPTPLPLFDKNEGKSNQSPVGIARKMEEKSFDMTLTQLQQASTDLAELADRVGHFTNWWDSVKTSLRSLQTVVPLITHDGRNPLREVSVRKRWERVKSDYVQYQSQISIIRDYYPIDLSDGFAMSTGSGVSSPPSPNISVAEQPPNNKSRGYNKSQRISPNILSTITSTGASPLPHVAMSASERQITEITGGSLKDTPKRLNGLTPARRDPSIPVLDGTTMAKGISPKADGKDLRQTVAQNKITPATPSHLPFSASARKGTSVSDKPFHPNSYKSSSSDLLHQGGHSSLDHPSSSIAGRSGSSESSAFPLAPRVIDKHASSDEMGKGLFPLDGEVLSSRRKNASTTALRRNARGLRMEPLTTTSIQPNPSLVDAFHPPSNNVVQPPAANDFAPFVAEHSGKRGITSLSNNHEKPRVSPPSPSVGHCCVIM